MSVAYLYQVLAFSFGDEWLKFWCRKCIDKTRLGHDQQQYLCTREYGQFVGLYVVSRFSM